MLPGIMPEAKLFRSLVRDAILRETETPSFKS
jgi:hypothetical protein